MLISQVRDGDGVAVVVRDGSEAAIVTGATGTYALAMAATAEGLSLADIVARRGLGPAVDLAALTADGQMLLPLTHPDPARMHLSGTGLTPLGSAATPDAMHVKPDAEMTDSMRMFRMGVEGASPPPCPARSRNGSTKATGTPP